VDNRSEYLTALREADKDNLRPFVDFIFSRSIATFVSVRPRHLDVPEVSGADTDLRGEPLILGELLREAPGQQISKAVVRVVGDALKHEAQIRLGIEAIELGGFEQRVERGGALTAGVCAGDDDFAANRARERA